MVLFPHDLRLLHFMYPCTIETRLQMSSKIYPPAIGTQIDYSVFVRVYFVCCSRAQAKYLLTNTVVAHGGDATKDLYTATIS